MRQIDELRKQEQGLRARQTAIQARRRATFSELRTLPPEAQEGGAAAVASMDIQLDALKGQIESAAAAVKAEEARLNGPAVQQAAARARALHGELEAGEAAIRRALAALEPDVEKMRAKFAEWIRAREQSGEDFTGEYVDFDPHNCYFEKAAEFLRNMRGLNMVGTNGTRA